MCLSNFQDHFFTRTSHRPEFPPQKKHTHTPKTNIQVAPETPGILLEDEIPIFLGTQKKSLLAGG